MKKQTLVQAIHVAFTGKSRSLGRAIHRMHGTIGNTAGQAYRQLVDEDLPARRDRSYTARQFIEAAYTQDAAERYETRSYNDAIQLAAEIEARTA